MKKLLLIAGCLAFAVACAISEPETVTVTEEVPVTVEATRLVEVEVEVTRQIEVEVTRVVTETIIETVEVTAIPTEAAAPFELVSIEGSGNTVTENFEWPACEKAVFNWTAAGNDNLIIYIHKIGVDGGVLQVNEIGPGSGQFLQPLLGGTYFYNIEGPADGWTLDGECQQ